MRGDERGREGMFSYVTLEQRVPQDHPLREIRNLTDTVLRSLSAEFDRLYSASGRPSIAPEYVLRALLLQAFYSVPVASGHAEGPQATDHSRRGQGLRHQGLHRS